MSRLPGSLQGRLALAIGLGIALLWAATAVTTTSILRREMGEMFDSTLEETAQRLLPLAVLDIIDREEQGVSRRISTLRTHDEFFTYLVRDDQGRILLRSHRAVEADFPPFEGTGFRQTATHRLYYDAALQGTITIAVAEPLDHRDRIERETQMAMALPLLLLVPLSLIGILWMVRRTLRPVRALSAALATRGGGDLSPVDSGTLPAEITPVARAINQLLSRLRATLDAERSFTANAAHELRTPLAAALAQTQRLIAETRDADAARRAGDIESALKRLSRMSEKLMQLSRAESGRLHAETASDMRPLLKMIATDVAGPSAADRIDLRLPDTPVMSDMDPDAFAILTRNLIENALKHSPADSPVQVTLSAAGSLGVINDGPALAPESLARLTARFERGEATADGSGLGLAIARAIAEGVHGQLELHSPAPSRSDGFEAVFRMPPR
ncbi:HAMP domain-containing protein [Stappia taiwanensis]|uniref:histidine kinase n=1 Tax=Stappia taiwanensis TaxID=992267 RepID=A0A838XVR6_9HYPH|nr:ATP-binding protein [Stappia taiwanensis]MBA4613111.1 HAMP domain-containing protein [Stappia taiwanensis]GGF01119.1 two-component sensor histidine kinase [Stappia taiwanensis]